MKQFENLMEAVTYHRFCYACNIILDHNLQLNIDPNECVYKWNLSDNVDSEVDEWVTINAYSNDIVYFEQSRRAKYEIDEIFHNKYNSTISGGPTKYTKKSRLYGTLYESIHIQCGKCAKFSYTIQVVLDLMQNRCAGIFLNSEHICYVDDKHYMHGIRNHYALSETCYNFTTPDGISNKKNIVVPLIPVDLKNPAETVARIKKLAIFS
jgi:hypothetical protein